MALQELTRRKPILKNRTPPEVEAIFVQLSLEQPAFGQIRIANELRKLGHSISPAGVRGVWQLLSLGDDAARLLDRINVRQRSAQLAEASIVSFPPTA